MKVVSCLIKIKDEVVDWLISFWQYFCRKLENTPWYLKPLYTIFFLVGVLHEIGRIQINIFSRKFKTWETFEQHLDKIMDVLKRNNELDWARRLYEAKYVSQSSWEVIYELIDELQLLNNNVISKKLNQRKSIKKAISYLRSFK